MIWIGYVFSVPEDCYADDKDKRVQVILHKGGGGDRPCDWYQELSELGRSRAEDELFYSRALVLADGHGNGVS